jgi:Rrf2 family nitric oxide-sensitive transcriptional repressor
MYVAVNHGISTIGGCAAAYGISKKHLEKVAPLLVKKEFLTTVKGRGGGLLLARPPEEISIGQVVRVAESNFEIAECFGSNNTCIITPECRLRHMFADALDAYLTTLDRHTLAGLVVSNTALKSLLTS